MVSFLSAIPAKCNCSRNAFLRNCWVMLAHCAFPFIPQISFSFNLFHSLAQPPIKYKLNWWMKMKWNKLLNYWFAFFNCVARATQAIACGSITANHKKQCFAFRFLLVWLEQAGSKPKYTTWNQLPAKQQFKQTKQRHLFDCFNYWICLANWLTHHVCK